MDRIRHSLSYANVMATLAFLIAVAGGTAYAANTIGSSDIINGQVNSPDIGNNQVQSVDVRDDTLAGGGLTGADIADQSGVDTCVLTNRLGQLCVRAENCTRTYFEALAHCGNLGLQVPTLGEALALARAYDIPNVGESEAFWTDEYAEGDALYVNDSGSFFFQDISVELETVCVTTPTN